MAAHTVKRLVIVTAALYNAEYDIAERLGITPRRDRRFIFVTDYEDTVRVMGLENFKFVFHGREPQRGGRIREFLLAVCRATEVANLEEALTWLTTP